MTFGLRLLQCIDDSTIGLSTEGEKKTKRFSSNVYANIHSVVCAIRSLGVHTV